jgi:hypothetical protein
MVHDMEVQKALAFARSREFLSVVRLAKTQFANFLSSPGTVARNSSRDRRRLAHRTRIVLE